MAPYGFHCSANSQRPIGPGPKAPDLLCLWEGHPDGGTEWGSRLIAAHGSAAQAMLVPGERGE